MQPVATKELSERAQRRIALGFSTTLAVTGTALLVLTPTLIPGMRGDVPYYRSPAFFPMAALALLAVAAALHALRLLRGASMEADDIDEPASNWRMVLIACSSYAGYIALVPLVGYAAATVSFLFVLGFLARLGWRLPLFVATVLTGVLFAVFVLGLNVWFPSASLAIGR